jgi:uncharacterized protein (DUF2236 family)
MSVPAVRASWLGGAGLLGSSLRARLGIHWSIRDEAGFQALGAFCRGLTPILPERLRVTGPAQLRRRRRAIASGPLGGEDGDPDGPARGALGGENGDPSGPARGHAASL